MKQFRRTLALVLAALTLLAALGTAALADYKVVTVTKGKWYKVYSEEKTKNIYKLTLSKDSLLTCTTKNQTEQSILEFEIFLKKSCDWDCYSGGFGLCVNGSTSETIALAKGTYYFKVYDKSGKPSFKLTTKAIPSYKNTTKAKAATLKQNAKVMCTHTQNGPKNLWYKIKLTKKQKISIGMDPCSGYRDLKFITLYNSQGKKVALKYGESWEDCVTKSKQSAGTYYIQLKNPNFEYKQGGYGNLYWY